MSDSRHDIKLNSKNTTSLKAYKKRTKNPASLPVLANSAVEFGLPLLPQQKWGK